MKKRIILISFLVIIFSLVTVGCGKKNNQPQPKSESSGTQKLADLLIEQKQLKKFSSPEEIKNFFANRSFGSASYFVSDNMARTDSFGVLGNVAQESKVAAPAATGMGSGNNFSTTNVQVAGVDEDDVVKTDGNFIYTLNNNSVSIIKAQPAADAEVISSIKLDGYGQAIYLAADKLVVFGDDQSMNITDSKMFIRPNSYIYLSIYDIKDKTQPKLLKTYKFEGGYVSSRLIDNKLYFISSTYNFYPAGDFILPKVYADNKLISSEKSSPLYTYPEVYYVDTSSYYNATTVSLISLNELDKPLTSQVYMMPSGENVYASTNNLYLTYTKYLSDYQLRMSVARELLFDKLSAAEQKRILQISEIDSSILNDDEKAAKVNQVIDGFFARLSDDQRAPLLKQLDEEFANRYQDIYKELEKTVIHKIGLENGGLVYKGSGEVSGHTLNQFSMDEYNGNLRIATTRSQSWLMPLAASFRANIMPPVQTQESYNNVYVLDDKLATIGSVEKLANGERIYSVRFIGDRGYVVTFKQTDPLFALDLKDPTKPTVAGQLKIPGFSSYLHPYKENMLIGVGKEAVDNGAQGVNVLGIKLSLFDVSDIANPKELSNISLGGHGSDTSVLFDHKAFLLIPDKDLVAIPMSLTKPNSNDYVPEFQGLGIFKIEANKISEIARFYHPMKAENLPAGVINMEAIMRSLYINDNLYTVSPSMLGIHQLTNFKNIKIINLSNPKIEEVPSGSSPVPMPYEKKR